MNFSIRKAKKQDFEEFLRLHKIFEEEYCSVSISENFRYSEKQIIDDFRNKLKNYFLVVELDNKLIGYLEGVFYKEWKRGYISDMFVLKEFRNKRIASNIKDRFMEELIKRNYKQIDLDVNIKNPAFKIYKKWGFKIVKYRMVKEL